MIERNKTNKNKDLGFSLIELLVVMAILSIMAGLSLLYLNASEKLYKPDVSSLQIVDLLQEARQRSLTQRETMRIEIDLDDKLVRLIDENTSATENDDIMIRSAVLFPFEEIKLDQRPLNIAIDPPEFLPAPHALFTLSNYPRSIAHRTCTIRFLSNGSVVDAGSTPTGSNANTRGVTLFVWAPKTGNPLESDISRAITIIGTTGSIRMWEYDINSSDSNKWKNSRRSSGYGG